MHEKPFNYVEPSPEVSDDKEKYAAAEPIPTYDPEQQFTVEDLERVYPNWREEVEGDADLVAVGYTRTKTLREIAKKTSLGNNLVYNGGMGLEWAIDHTPKEVGQRYAAHGIANKYDPVQAMDALLRSGIDPSKPLYSMSFINAHEASGAFGADRPLTSGGFVLVGEKGRALEESGIKYVVIGEEYCAVLDILQQRYPGVTFIPWDKAPAFFTQMTNEAGETNIALKTLEPAEPPTYPVVAKIVDVPTAYNTKTVNSTPTPPPDDSDADIIW